MARILELLQHILKTFFDFASEKFLRFENLFKTQGPIKAVLRLGLASIKGLDIKLLYIVIKAIIINNLFLLTLPNTHILVYC